MEETEFECPKCGEPLLANDFLYECSAKDSNGCEFKLWKNQKGIKVTVEDDVFAQMNSEEGYEFEKGIVRIDITKEPFYTNVEWKKSTSGFEVKKEFHLNEFTSPKSGQEIAIWNDELKDGDEKRKTIYKNFWNHEITEEEAKTLFSGESVTFDDLTNKSGEVYSATYKLNLNESTGFWGLIKA